MGTTTRGRHLELGLTAISRGHLDWVVSCVFLGGGGGDARGCRLENSASVLLEHQKSAGKAMKRRAGRVSRSTPPPTIGSSRSRPPPGVGLSTLVTFAPNCCSNLNDSTMRGQRRRIEWGRKAKWETHGSRKWRHSISVECAFTCDLLCFVSPGGHVPFLLGRPQGGFPKSAEPVNFLQARRFFFFFPFFPPFDHMIINPRDGPAQWNSELADNWLHFVFCGRVDREVTTTTKFCFRGICRSHPKIPLGASEEIKAE